VGPELSQAVALCPENSYRNPTQLPRLICSCALVPAIALYSDGRSWTVLPNADDHRVRTEQVLYSGFPEPGFHHPPAQSATA
jgi:hypothetical protein